MSAKLAREIPRNPFKKALMATQETTPKEAAERYLNNSKDFKCPACGATDRWRFIGISLTRVYMVTDQQTERLGLATYVCDRCHVALQVDCAGAQIPFEVKA